MAIGVYKKDSVIKLSKNFRVSEFACKGKSCGCTTVMVDDELVDYLQQIRDHFGKAVIITSGYRCTKHNSNVGGVTGSQHIRGCAADISVKKVAPAKVAKYAESIGVLGIGLYETDKDGYFVHIDTRKNKAFWYGQAQASRDTFGGALTYTVKVTAWVLNIRSGAGTKYKVTGWARKGQTYTITETADGWGKTDQGWISLKHTERIR